MTILMYLELQRKEEANEIKAKALKVNEVLTEIFAGVDVRLIDFKLRIWEGYRWQHFISR